DNPRLTHPVEDGIDGSQAPVSEVPVPHPQSLVTVEQELQIPVQKAVAPQPGKYPFQVKGQIFQGQRPVVGNLQVVIYQFLVLQEDLINDVRLVAEVVIEISRRNGQMGRNVIGGDIALSPLIEQLQTGKKNLVSGFHDLAAFVVIDPVA